jgi:magnesium and cobalt transporter
MIKRVVAKLFPQFATPPSLRQELTDLLEESVDEKAGFDSHEGTLLRNFLGLRDLTAADVMIPRADIVSVDMAESFTDIIRQMSEANHSRVPVRRQSLDDIAGIIHIKDVFAHMRAGDAPEVESLLRPALFVAPTIRLLDLFHEMRLRRRHLALVVDEFGGVDGLITIEDLVEEIVGEIEDEHDETVLPRFEFNDDGTAVAEARLEVEELERHTGALLDEDERDEIDTLGGLVCSVAGRVPGRGEVVRHPSGLQFEVLEGDPRRITLLKIRGLARVVSPQSGPKTDPQTGPKTGPQTGPQTG